MILDRFPFSNERRTEEAEHNSALWLKSGRPDTTPVLRPAPTFENQDFLLAGLEECVVVPKAVKTRYSTEGARNDEYLRRRGHPPIVEAYSEVYPGVGLVLLEPSKDDYQMFFTNVFSVRDRRVICEHAYRSTRRILLARKHELSETFGKYGIHFRVDHLEDASHDDVWARVRVERPGVTDRVPALDDGGLHAGKRNRGVTRDLRGALDRLEALLDVDEEDDGTAA